MQNGSNNCCALVSSRRLNQSSSSCSECVVVSFMSPAIWWTLPVKVYSRRRIHLAHTANPINAGPPASEERLGAASTECYFLPSIVSSYGAGDPSRLRVCVGRHHHLMLWSFREYTGLSLPSPQSGIGTMFIHTELLIRLIKMILAGVDR